jgi:hypothetical protein
VNGYLLDTNVVSERRRPRPERRVAAFLDSVEDEPLYLSVMTIGELRQGAEQKARRDKPQARRLLAWIEGLEVQYADTILPVDLETAHVWAAISARRPTPVVDAILAATALVNDLILVTRNVRDFKDAGVPVVNPWEGPQ